MAEKRYKAELPKERTFYRVNTALIKNAKIIKFSLARISRSAFTKNPSHKKNVDESVETPVLEKIHPVLKKWITLRPNETEQIIINFRDDLKIPPFPEPNPNESRKSVDNKKVLKRTEVLISKIKKLRADTYAKLVGEITDRFEVRVLDKFWLINAVLAEASLKEIPKLIERTDIIYAQPRYGGEEPPLKYDVSEPRYVGEGPPLKYDVSQGRRRIASDPYFELGLKKGWIGLLDTGLRFTHTLFSSPSHLGFRRDCINGGADCSTGRGLNANDDYNHGTCAAAIITANSNQGNGSRGATAVKMDSFKVYSDGALDTDAVIRAFQAALASLDRIIVAEVQGLGNHVCAISSAANNAFDAGAVIVAANGNNGPNSNTVNAPANAHKVIGVGDYDVRTLSQIQAQSRGPSADNRVKPDIQAPTNTETASNHSDTASRVFSGTSGATPYAAAAAALLRNWLRRNSHSIDPGQVYVHLILSGVRYYPFDNTTGAGPLELPTDGWVWWGKVAISNGVTLDIPLEVKGAWAWALARRTLLGTGLDGALWWPESPQLPHNDIDLYLIDPSGVERASSLSVKSIFERARFDGPVATGRWKLRIRGYDVRTGLQNVYWAAHVRVG